MKGLQGKVALVTGGAPGSARRSPSGWARRAPASGSTTWAAQVRDRHPEAIEHGVEMCMKKVTRGGRAAIWSRWTCRRAGRGRMYDP